LIEHIPAMAGGVKEL